MELLIKMRMHFEVFNFIFWFDLVECQLAKLFIKDAQYEKKMSYIYTLASSIFAEFNTKIHYVSHSIVVDSWTPNLSSQVRCTRKQFVLLDGRIPLFMS